MGLRRFSEPPAPTQVAIYCSVCSALVHAKVLGSRTYGPTEEADLSLVLFVECPHCTRVMLGESECAFWDMAGDIGWERPKRLWPDPDQYVHPDIPAPAQRSLEEAKRCFANKAYMACAVMCGRAVEALCADILKSKNLAEGLRKLRSEKIIDEKLYEWSEALRTERNIGAHAGDQVTSYQDAKDVLDFAHAICDYVCVLDKKYKAYRSRKEAAD